MTKILLSKKINAIFLATILIAGTVALLSPSFTTDAQAVSKYGKEANSSQHNKCTNINLNFPGLDFNLNPPTTDEIGASSLARDGPNNGENNGPNGNGISLDKNQVFVCINANDNSVRGGIDRGDGDGEPTPQETCEDCFADSLGSDFQILLQAIDNDLIFIELPESGEGVEIHSLDRLCDELGTLTGEQLVFAVNQVLEEASISLLFEDYLALLTCLGKVFDVTIPPQAH